MQILLTALLSVGLITSLLLCWFCYQTLKKPERENYFSRFSYLKSIYGKRPALFFMENTVRKSMYRAILSTVILLAFAFLVRENLFLLIAGLVLAVDSARYYLAFNRCLKRVISESNTETLADILQVKTKGKIE